MENHSFGTRLRKIRESKGLTQKELAQKIGISQRMMNYYEKRVVSPPLSLFSKLSRALRVSADELLAIKELPKDEALLLERRLLRRFKAVKELSEQDRRNVFALIRALHSKIHHATIQGQS